MARISKPKEQPSRDDILLPDGNGAAIPPPRVPARPVAEGSGDGRRRGGSGGGRASHEDRRPFLIEVRDELRKVTWPDREHLTQATAVVLIVVLVAAAYLSALDAIFQRLIGAVL